LAKTEHFAQSVVEVREQYGIDAGPSGTSSRNFKKRCFQSSVKGALLLEKVSRREVVSQKRGRPMLVSVTAEVVEAPLQTSHGQQVPRK
jgi:hypothetical protein